MSLFSDMIVFMTEADIIQLFFPWLLLLAFTFGVLQKYDFFDEEVNGAIALSSSFLAVAGIYLFMPEGVFSYFGGIVALAAFASLGALVVMALAGIQIDDLEGRLKYAPLGLGGLVLSIGLIGMATGFLPLEAPVELVETRLDLVDEVLMPLMFFGFVLAIIYISMR